MSKIDTRVSMLLFLIVFIFLLMTGCQTGQLPAILFDGEKYIFGEVTAGEDIVFTFAFSNPGTGELRITDLYVLCDCVVVKEYDKQLKPGGKGKIYGVVHTKGFQGKVVKAIKVETNIPKAEPYILSLEGTILPPNLPPSPAGAVPLY